MKPRFFVAALILALSVLPAVPTALACEEGCEADMGYSWYWASCLQTEVDRKAENICEIEKGSSKPYYVLFASQTVGGDEMENPRQRFIETLEAQLGLRFDEPGESPYFVSYGEAEADRLDAIARMRRLEQNFYLAEVTLEPPVASGADELAICKAENMPQMSGEASRKYFDHHWSEFDLNFRATLSTMDQGLKSIGELELAERDALLRRLHRKMMDDFYRLKALLPRLYGMGDLKFLLEDMAGRTIWASTDGGTTGLMQQGFLRELMRNEVEIPTAGPSPRSVEQFFDNFQMTANLLSAVYEGHPSDDDLQEMQVTFEYMGIRYRSGFAPAVRAVLSYNSNDFHNRILPAHIRQICSEMQPDPQTGEIISAEPQLSPDGL